MWQLTDRGWLYIGRDADCAGNSIVAMAVSDIEEVARRSERGVLQPCRSSERTMQVARP
jgi:hypothetical protein